MVGRMGLMVDTLAGNIDEIKYQLDLIFMFSLNIEQQGIGYLHGFVPELSSSSGTWYWDIDEVLKHFTWIGYIRQVPLEYIAFELNATRRVKLKSIANI